MKRRAFLAGAAAASAAPLLNSCRAHESASAPASGAAPAGVAADLSDWEQVRRQFPLDYSWVQMAQFLMASHPAAVRAAIETHRRGLDENPALYIEENVGRCEAATRDAAAAYMGCQRDDLAMTDSTTMGLGLFYGGLKLKPGQEILTTTITPRPRTCRSRTPPRAPALPCAASRSMKSRARPTPTRWRRLSRGRSAPRRAWWR